MRCLPHLALLLAVQTSRARTWSFLWLARASVNAFFQKSFGL